MTIPLGVRVKPSRKGKVYRAFYDELRADVVAAMNEQKALQAAGHFTSTELEFLVMITAIRRFSAKSVHHREYAQLILECWDI